MEVTFLLYELKGLLTTREFSGCKALVSSGLSLQGARVAASSPGGWSNCFKANGKPKILFALVLASAC